MSEGVFGELTDIEQEYLQKTRRSYDLDQEASRFLPGGSTRSATMRSSKYFKRWERT